MQSMRSRKWRPARSVRTSSDYKGRREMLSSRNAWKTGTIRAAGRLPEPLARPSNSAKNIANSARALSAIGCKPKLALSGACTLLPAAFDAMLSLISGRHIKQPDNLPLLIRTERAGRHFLLLKESPSASPPAFAIPTFRTVSPAVDKTSTMLFGFANHALMVSTYTSGISWIATFRSTRLMVSEWSIPARC